MYLLYYSLVIVLECALLLIKQVFAIKVGCFLVAAPTCFICLKASKDHTKNIDLDLQIQFPEHLHLCCGDRVGRSHMSSEVIFQIFPDDWY